MLNMLERIYHYASLQPNTIGLYFLNRKLDPIASFTYQTLLHEVIKLGHFLQDQTQKGDRVLISYEPGLDFVIAFLACQYAGVIAVPTFPPFQQKAKLRLMSIIETAKPTGLLTSSGLAKRIAQLLADTHLRIITTDDSSLENHQQWSPRPHEIAFLQYTSGTTGNPKGVIIAQKNLSLNLQMIAQNFGNSRQTIGMVWLPPYHDMGLIGGILQPLFFGFPVYLMSPMTFLQNPIIWLQAISQFRATASGGPNFSYALVVQSLQNQLTENLVLDLSTWEVAFNGAEPINFHVMQQFIKATEAYGFRHDAMHPCYGLAEATLFVSGKKKLTKPNIFWVKTNDLQQREIILVPHHAGNDDVTPLISCGMPDENLKIAIIDPETKQTITNGVGEISISGASVSPGYWQSIDQKESHRSDNYFSTGDLGCLINGELVICGRLKDLIILNGTNYYAHEIEFIVQQSHSHLKSSSCVGFSVPGAATEQLIILVELNNSIIKTNQAEIFDAILKALSHQQDCLPHQIGLVRLHVFPKTTSGKIARQDCRDRRLAGRFQLIATWIKPTVKDEIAHLKKPATCDAIDLKAWISAWFIQKMDVEIIWKDHQPLAYYGVDSISLQRLIVDLESYLNEPIDPTLLWKATSLNNFVAMLAQKNSSDLPVIPTVLPPSLSLSIQEEWLLSLMKKDPKNPAYTICFAFEMNEGFSETAFQQALKTILDRELHLRTAYLHEEKVRLLKPDISWQGEIISLVHLSSLEQETQIGSMIKQLAHTRWDLNNPPFIKAIAILLASDRFLIGIAASHLIVDGWGMALLIERFVNNYRHKNAELKPSLSYAHYAIWQRQLLADGSLNQQQIFWAETVKNWREPCLPYQSQPKPNVNVAVDYIHFDHQLIHTLKNKIKQKGLNLFNYFFAGWQLTLFNYFDQGHVTMKVLSANRFRSKTHNIIGFLANGLLFCQHYPDKIDLDRFVNLSNSKLHQMMHAQDYPFELLSELRKIKPHRSCKVVFNWHSFLSPKLAGTLKIKPRLDLFPDNFLWSDGTELACHVCPDGASYVAKIRYQSHLLDPAFIKELIANYQDYLYRLAW